MTCQAGDIARVYFKYPDSNLDSVVSKNCPVEATLQEAIYFTGGQCSTHYDVTYNSILPFTTDCTYTPASYGQATVRLMGAIEGIAWEFYLDGNRVVNPVQQINNAILYIYHNGIKHYIGGTSGGICQLREAYSAGIIDVIRIDGKPDNCGDPNRCIFTITDTTGVIYSRIEKKCPKVSIQCSPDECPKGYKKVPIVAYPGYVCKEVCPPETCCECDCGDLICCYGKQGQILKTIRK